MNVKAIIREVLVELSSKGTPASAPGTPDKLLATRWDYLDSFVDEYNARRRAGGGFLSPPSRDLDEEAPLNSAGRSPR